jgi:hypothetical protein
MKPVVKKATPAAIAVLRQATAISPSRKKASDGLLPSRAHLKQNPNSDHNSGLAVDLTHDPKKKIDCADIFKQLQNDPRVSYLIFNHRIWTPQRGVDIYTGSNPHTNHIHISIKENRSKDTSPWFAWLDRPVYKTADQARLAALKIKPLPKKKVKK